MKYYLDTMQEEHVILHTNRHWSWLLLPAGLALLVLLGEIARKETLYGIVAALLILLLAAIPMLSKQLVLTNKRVYGQSGILWTRTLDIPLNKICSVWVSSGLLGKLFGCGSIVISSPAGKQVFFGMLEPARFRRALLEEMERDCLTDRS